MEARAQRERAEKGYVDRDREGKRGTEGERERERQLSLTKPSDSAHCAVHVRSGLRTVQASIEPSPTPSLESETPSQTMER